MDNAILGLHHITAIAGDAQRNHDFYTKMLGLRLVKKTVNFDDPGTYHFYYGNETGAPGTILTFFPWARVRQGHNGIGLATNIDYTVPEDSLGFWKDRFEKENVPHSSIMERFGEKRLPFRDPDGLQLTLVAAADSRKPWTTNEVNTEVAIRGFQGVELSVRDKQPTAAILTGIFGYRLSGEEGNRSRFITDVAETANLVDIVELPDGAPGIGAGGTNHHVAFRVANEEVLMHFRSKIEAAGFHITPKIDRNYFYSLYFREPNGILFEIATDNPGFAIDEDEQSLGQSLKLPTQYESNRAEIERRLPVIHS